MVFEAPIDRCVYRCCGLQGFCHVCCKAKALGLLTLPKSYNATFVEGGFSNWKKALERFGQHEGNEMHQEAMAKLAAKFSAVDVRAQLSRQHEAEMKNQRAMFMNLLECVRYLARQGLPLRCHNEDSLTFDGNLLQLLPLQAKDDAHVGLWLKKRDYVSPDIINEIISLCGQKLLRQLLKESCEANFFALIVDEATDFSHNEQMCIAIRWVDSSYTIHEDAIGLIQASRHQICDSI